MKCKRCDDKINKGKEIGMSITKNKKPAVMIILCPLCYDIFRFLFMEEEVKQ